MSLIPSTMLPLGTTAPNFVLLDTVTNKPVSLQDVRGEKGTVVMFICNHCPFVKHVNEEIVRLANDYRVTGFGFVAISIISVFLICMMRPKKLLKPIMPLVRQIFIFLIRL